MSRFDLTTFGEALLRLSVPVGRRLAIADQLDLHAAGAEANVAAALAGLGRRTRWIGGLPRNPLGERVANQLRQCGVDLDAVNWCDKGRLGTYFIEFAVPPRSIQVVYDRADACITTLQPDDIDWDRLLDSQLIHLTGITPPLSAGCEAIVARAIERARAAGVAISFDINYRGKLWSPSAAADALRPLIQSVDLLFCSIRDARQLFGCQGDATAVVDQLAEQSQARHIILTLAEQGVMGWDGTTYYPVPARPVEIVDRIGAGDALAAGVIDGWLAGDFAQGLQAGVVMAALALSQHGDIVMTNRAELAALLDHQGGGVVR